MKVEVNPSDHARFLSALNKSFGHWGDQHLYDWCFARDAGAGVPDRFVLTDEAGTWMAGSAIEHRYLVYRGERIRVGIITGSWTAEEFRGRGLFSRVITETLAMIARRGGVAMIGMGRQDNASHSRLVAAGGRVVEGLYGVSQLDQRFAASTASLWTPQDDSPARLAFLARLAAAGPVDRPRFDYGDIERWAEQIVHRPCPTEILSDGQGNWAVIEKAVGNDRLSLLVHEHDTPKVRAQAMQSLLARAAASGTKFFIYATSPEDRATVAGLGLVRFAAALTVTPAGDAPETLRVVDQLGVASWRLDNGDRM